MGRLVVLFLCLIVVVLLNLTSGSFELSFIELWQSDVLWQLRLPRTLVALIAGALLALSGHVTQILFRNALATPYTLGVASSAGLGAMLAMSFGFNFLMVTFSSFLTALLGLVFLAF